MPLPDPLRVLHVITSTEAGGAERMLRRNLRAMGKLEAPGIQAEVLCIKDLGPIGQRLLGEGFVVRALGAQPPGGVAATLAWPFREMRVALAIRRAIRRFRPHVVQSWLPRADLVTRFAAAGSGVPVISSVRIIDRDRSWPARLDGLTRGLVSRWLAVSEAAADHQSKLSGIPRDRFTVIPNALEPEEMLPPAEAGTFRARHGLAPDAFVVASLARLHPQKALDQLVRAASLLPESSRVVVAIAGTGPQRAELQGLAESLRVHGRVQFLGRLDEPRELLAAADAFVLPSLFEGMPGALLEAMAMGLPCVATAIPGTIEIVRDGVTAVLVPPSDAPAIAAELERFEGDPLLRERLGCAAREAVLREHGMALHARRVLELWASVLR